MNKVKNRSIHKNGGITLIALVITIIVLLILAGVSIAMLTGENGLLTKAADAKDNTRGGSVKEAVDLAVTENSLTKHTGGTIITKSSLVNQLHNENKLTDEEYNKLLGLNGETEVDVITIGNITIDFSKILSSSGVTLGANYQDSWIGKRITYSANNESNWIIIGQENDGDVLITTATPVGNYTVRKDLANWCDYETNLNNLCSQYAGTIGSKNVNVREARSITMDDVNLCLGVTIPETFNKYTFCSEQDFANKKVNYYFPDETNKTWVKPTATNTWNNIEDNAYNLSMASYNPETRIVTLGYQSFANLNERIELNSIEVGKYGCIDVDEYYWIASRFIHIDNSQAHYYVATSNIYGNGIGLNMGNYLTVNECAFSNSNEGTDVYDYIYGEVEGAEISLPYRPVVVLPFEVLYDDVEIGDYY